MGCVFKMKHELLVPAQNMLCLKVAINNGADAIYIGGKKYGAREYADNFTLEEIEEATKLCHLYNVKLYVTVNTLVFENEIDDVMEYIDNLHKIGVDALIMQDVGLIDLTHQTYPNLEIHASTQMHNFGIDNLEFLESLGIKRVVFAREMPLSTINNIKTNLEKEVFIHGSLCISYSGQCYLSECILKRSGNRGACAGLCRLPYKLYENDKCVKSDGDYILSTRDLISITNFKELMDSNVKCFKVEGRMKSELYVGVVTRIYKTLMTQYELGQELHIDDELLNLLKAVFNREYTSGYLFKDNNIMNYLQPNHIGIKIGNVINVTNKKIKIKLNKDLHQFEGVRFKNSKLGMIVNFIYDKNDKLVNKGLKDDVIYLDNVVGLKEIDEVLLTNPIVKMDKEITKKIDVDIKFTAYLNDKMTIVINDNENEIKLIGDEVLLAKNMPITKERVNEILSKTGSTSFKVLNIDIEMDDNVFIPVGILNEFRRNALNKLKELRENKKNEYVKRKYIEKEYNYKKTSSLSVLVRTKEQLDECVNLGVENIIVINKDLMCDNYIYRTVRGMEKSYDYKKLLVTDYNSLVKYKNSRADYFLNITNHYTLNKVLEYSYLPTLSIECSINNIKDILDKYKNIPNVEVLVYGNVEVMLMKYCPLKSIVNKDKVCSVCKNDNKYYLKDRNNKYFRILNNEGHNTILLNCNKTNNIESILKLKSIGVTNFRIEFLDEDKFEVRKIIDGVKKYI